MVKCKLLFFITILSTTNLIGQQTKYQISTRFVTGLDKFSYQLVNIDTNRDEFLSDNSIGAGFSYSYKLSKTLSVIGSIEFQKIEGSVNASENSDYLNTANTFYSLGFQSDITALPLYFDLSYLYINTKFSYDLNSENLSNRSIGHGLKLGINYSHWLSKSSGVTLGMYSYGVIIGDAGFDIDGNSTDNYHDTSIGVLTSIQIGYLLKF